MNSIVICTTQLSATINVHGAELISLSKPGQPSVLWSKQTEHWNRIAPNLFPIVGRLKDDTFFYKNSRYELGQHGFARDMDFEVEHQEDDAVTLILKSNDRTILRYPFLFEFRVRFEIFEHTLKISYETTNIGSNEMCYSVGGHPAFNLDNSWESYKLMFHPADTCAQSILHGSFFTGEEQKVDLINGLALNNHLFDHDAIVFKKPSFHSLTIFKSEVPLFHVKGDWDSFALWSKPGAPFLCLEPWWGYADDIHANQQLESKAGIRKLQPNQRESLSYSIELV